MKYILTIALCCLIYSAEAQTKHISFSINDSTWLKPGGFVTYVSYGKEVEKQIQFILLDLDKCGFINVPTGIWVMHKGPCLFVFTDGTPIKGNDLDVSGYYEIEKNTAP